MTTYESCRLGYQTSEQAARAAALLIAEIERIDRAEVRNG